MTKRFRFRLQSTKLKISYNTRPKDYCNLRFWWLHELRTLRAKRRYGTGSIKDVKIAQRELARLRREYCG